MRIKIDTIKKIAFIVIGEQLLNKGFAEWFKFFFKKVRGYEFIEQPLHTEKLFPAIEDITKNKIRRIKINMPPRSCKTTMMVFLMAYVIAQKKPFNFIYTSYSGDLLAKCANELKAILENDFFIQCYRNSISEIINENDMVDTFGNTKTSIVKNPKNNEKFTRKQFIFKDGSTIQFSSTGGSITGFGAGAVVEDDSYFSGAVIIDDPNNPFNAFSQIMNKRIQDWYDNVAMTRNNGKASKDGKLKGTIIVVQQRVCPDDLSGYIQNMYKKQFNNVICKLINDDGKCTLPDFYNQNDLEELQIKRIRFLTQYQQEAEIDKDQLLFNLDSFVFISQNYIDNQIIKMALLTTDLSNDNQGEDNDFTCFCLWIITNDYKLILLDCFYKQLHHSIDRTELIASFYNRHSKLKPMILIENAGENSFRQSQLLKKYNINDVKMIERRGRPDINKPDTLFAGSKEIRLLNASEYVNVHKVFIKEEYKTIALNEAKNITLQSVNKVHDDFCDNLADACVVMQLAS